MASTEAAPNKPCQGPREGITSYDNSAVDFDGEQSQERKAIKDIGTVRSEPEVRVSLPTTAVEAPLDYVKSLPSKGVRSILIDAFDVWLQVPRDMLPLVKNMVDNLHTASLIMDDVEDRSPLRRGSPAAHCIFGVSQSINSASYTVLRTISQVADLDGGWMLKPILQVLERLFIGQSWDLYWTFHMIPPTEDEYFQMVDGKTGALFELAVRIMLLALKPRQECGPARVIGNSSGNLFSFARLLGRFFQIRDDYMNLTSDVYGDQKGTMEDLDEGKFSFPLILAIKESATTRNHILGVLRESKRPLTKESKEFIHKLVKKSGALIRTAQMLQNLHGEIELEIGSLERRFENTNSVLRELMKKLGINSPTDG